MAGPALGIQGAMALINQKANQQALQRAEQLQGITVRLHANAPRGGMSINAYGQPRSAPGEQPAQEHGTLMQALQDPLVPVGSLGYATVVNRRQLEFGTMHVAPRPMGRMAIEQLRQEVNSG